MFLLTNDALAIYHPGGQGIEPCWLETETPWLILNAGNIIQVKPVNDAVFAEDGPAVGKAVAVNLDNGCQYLLGVTLRQMNDALSFPGDGLVYLGNAANGLAAEYPDPPGK